MTYELAREIYDAISQTSLQSLKNTLLKKAIAYAHMRAEWKLADHETRIEMDTPRSIAHNAFIDACNILSRNMHLKGEDATWRKKLGEDRKEIGDFACYLHAILGIKAR